MPVKVVKPSERFYLLTENANRLLSLIGFDILAPVFKWRFITYVTMFSLWFFIAFTFYTLISEGMKDWRNMMKYSVMFGMGPIGLAKSFSGYRHAAEWRSVTMISRKIYKKYEIRSEKYSLALHKGVDRVDTTLKVIRIGYIVSFAGMMILPFVFLFLDGSRFMMLHYHIPGLDANTNMGYFLTNGLQSISLVLTGFGFYSGDIFVIISLTQALLYADIFRLHVEDINELLQQQDEHQIDQKQVENATECVTRMLIELIQWHQFYINYMNFVNDLSYLMISTQVLSSAFSVTVTLFALLALHGHVYYFVYLILIMYSMVVYCLLGTKIEYTNDDICYEAYNISWPDMNPAQRKMVRLMLMQTQKPIFIKILGVMPLSVSTVLEIMKVIYSMITMMTQFI